MAKAVICEGSLPIRGKYFLQRFLCTPQALTWPWMTVSKQQQHMDRGQVQIP